MGPKPLMDGKINQMEWKGSSKIGGFSLLWGQRNKQTQPSLKTEAWLGYDNDNLYIALKCFKDNVKNIKADARTRDGNVYKDDSVEIFLNTNPEKTGYYHFTVNAIGTQYDGFVKGSSAKIDQWDNFDLAINP